MHPSMTDEAREAAILEASAESQAASNRGDRPSAVYHLREMERLIKGRSQAQVASMEHEYFTLRGEQAAVRNLERSLAP